MSMYLYLCIYYLRNTTIPSPFLRGLPQGARDFEYLTMAAAPRNTGSMGNSVP